MKFFQYNKQTWLDENEICRMWQFGIIKNRALLEVSFHTPGSIVYCDTDSAGGIEISFSFFFNSLFGMYLKKESFDLGFDLYIKI